MKSGRTTAVLPLTRRWPSPPLRRVRHRYGSGAQAAAHRGQPRRHERPAGGRGPHRGDGGHRRGGGPVVRRPAAHGTRARLRLPELRRGRCPRGDRACRRAPRHRPGAHQHHRRLHGRRRRLVPGLPLSRPLRGGGAFLRLLRLPAVGEARGTLLPHAPLGGGLVAFPLGRLPRGQPAAHAAVDRPRGVGPRRWGRRARGALAPDGGSAGGEGVPAHLYRGARHRPRLPHAGDLEAGDPLAAGPAQDGVSPLTYP